MVWRGGWVSEQFPPLGWEHATGTWPRAGKPTDSSAPSVSLFKISRRRVKSVGDRGRATGPPGAIARVRVPRVRQANTLSANAAPLTVAFTPPGARAPFPESPSAAFPVGWFVLFAPSLPYPTPHSTNPSARGMTHRTALSPRRLWRPGLLRSTPPFFFFFVVLETVKHPVPTTLCLSPTPHPPFARARRLLTAARALEHPRTRVYTVLKPNRF